MGKFCLVIFCIVNWRDYGDKLRVIIDYIFWGILVWNNGNYLLVGWCMYICSEFIWGERC